MLLLWSWILYFCWCVVKYLFSNMLPAGCWFVPIWILQPPYSTSKHLFLCTFCNCSLKFITIFVSNPSSTKCYFRCAVILPSLQFLVISNYFFPDPSQHSAYSASPLTLTLTRPSTHEPLSAAGSLLSARPPHMLLSLPGKPHTAPPSSSWSYRRDRKCHNL